MVETWHLDINKLYKAQSGVIVFVFLNQKVPEPNRAERNPVSPRVKCSKSRNDRPSEELHPIMLSELKHLWAVNTQAPLVTPL